MGSFKLTIHMVSSLDGMIAKKDNSISWFETSDHYDKGVELSEQEIGDFLKTIDCYIMGSKTYEHAVALAENYGWAYGDTPTIVISRRDLAVDRQNVSLYSGDLKELVRERLQTNYQNVWLVGGPALAKEFIRLQLVDEIRITVLPVILGDGIRFFDGIETEHPLHLLETTAYKNGTVELRYEIKKG